MFQGATSTADAVGQTSLTAHAVQQSSTETCISACVSARALVVEDMREACVELRNAGYQCDRITHNELMASTGQEYTASLLKGEYSILWISTPSDWYVRTPGKRTNPHWQRIQHWMKQAVMLGMKLIIFGPPGFPWRIPNIREAIED
eukprot:4898730-Prorocentrum_lima.AAC.1